MRSTSESSRATTLGLNLLDSSRSRTIVNMDPLTIATGIITLYSVVWHLRRLSESFTSVPAVVANLERETSWTLRILIHTQWRLYFDSGPLASDDYNPTDIRGLLADVIGELRPEVQALRADLVEMLRPPETNFESIMHRLSMTHLSRLRRAHRAISERLRHFDRVMNAWNA